MKRAVPLRRKTKTMFDILNLLLLIVLVAFSIYYISDWVKGNDRKQAFWVEEVKSGKVESQTRKLYQRYKDKDRFIIFWLQKQRLEKEQIQGEIAELGVYRGETAAVLHALFPARPLHLFDTFRGFRADDLQNETGEAATYSTANFADTSVPFVKNKVGNSPLIHIHEGDFSETKKRVDSTAFALISLDADLEKPTAEGLAWFYPLLVPGGVLLVHDYNPKWPGLMRAVDSFVAQIPENPVLMPDRDGTIIIVKNKKSD
jgi:O-methyltransferase